MPKPSLDEIFGSSSRPSLDEIFGQQSQPITSTTEHSVSPNKNFWSRYNAEITPGMKQDYPILAGAADLAQKGLTIPLTFLNQFASNAPRALLNKEGYDFPKLESSGGRLAQDIAGVGGMLSNPINTMKAPMLLKAALSGAAYSTPENVSVNKEALLNRAGGAALGASVDLAGKGLGKVFNPADVINKFIGSNKKSYLFGRNPGKFVADENIVATSPEDLSAKIGNKLNKYSDKLDKVLVKYDNNKVIDGYKVLSPIDEAISKAAKENNEAAFNRLVKDRQAITDILKPRIAADGSMSVISTGKRELQNINPAQATEIKRIIGGLTKFTGTPAADKYANKALLKSYGSIRQEIEKVAPEAKTLNEKWSNLKAAKLALDAKDFNRGITMPEMLSGAVRGAAIGAVTGQPLVSAGAALATPLLEKATNNALIKTLQAQMYQQGGRLGNAVLPPNIRSQMALDFINQSQSNR